MYTPAFYQGPFEDLNKNFMPYDYFPWMVPYFESCNNDAFNKDLFNAQMLNDFKGADPSDFMFDFEKAMQTLPEEFKQWFPVPFETNLIPLKETVSPFTTKSVQYSPQNKIGNLSVEERRVKVQKYLEKRKKRNFKKKISYMCRKKVADKRVRIKGRFVSKIQAEEILNVKEKESDSN